MTKRLHTDSKIFFPNPYVVSLEHETELSDFEFQKIVRKVYKIIQGTWGYTTPQTEYIFPDPTVVKNSTKFLMGSGMWAVPGGTYANRSYWAFKEEVDALQFRLMIGDKSTHVLMWPNRHFTIHEVIETDES